MTRILRVETSIRGRASLSRRVTDAIIGTLVQACPEATVKLRDLSKGLPAIDAAWLDAVMTPQAERDDDQRSVALLSDTLLAELRAADVLVIGLPVYNFGIPATLKSWIDHVTLRGETFSYTEQGPVGLLKGKRAIVGFASDGTPVGSALDFATPYLRHALGFIGISDVEIRTGETLASAEDGALAA